jgi:hypothetical protein
MNILRKNGLPAKPAAVAFLLLAASTTGAMGAPSGDLAQQILAVHNKERAAVGVQPLVWSDGLAANAQPWAEHLAQLGDMQHSETRERPGEGENLAMGTAGVYSAADMARGWAGEKVYFQPGVFPDGVSANVNGDWHMMAHYTQMIWRGTQEVGCAMATGHGNDFLVCRYSPPGNFIGQKPY